MDVETIKAIAKSAGLDMGMFHQPALTDMGNGTLRFIESEELTHYGNKLVLFARAIVRMEYESKS